MKPAPGFTMIELMIVVAIVGILAAIALPQYQLYVARSKLVEITTNLDADKIAVTESFETNGTFAATAPFSTAVPGNAKYITAVAYNIAPPNAGVVMTVGNTGSPMDGKFLGLFAVGNADATVTWTCGTAAAATDIKPAAATPLYPYLPASCQN